MFEDVNIKSFKEYIAEQELLKKEDKPDFLKTAEEKIDEKYNAKEDESNKDTESIKKESEVSQEKTPAINTDVDTNKLHLLEADKLSDLTVTKEYLRKLVGNNTEQFKALNDQYNQLTETFKKLSDGQYITSKITYSNEGGKKAKEQQSAEEPDNQQIQANQKSTSPFVPLDLTAGKTIYSIVNEFKARWNAAIKTTKLRREKIQAYEKLKHPGLINRTKTQDAAAEVINKEETSNENENLLNEFLRTPGEIASGRGNKYNTTKILDKAEKYKDKNGNKGSIYNVDDDMINNIRDKYRNEAFKIIKKDIGYGLNYMKNVKKRIDRYASLSRYLPNGSNDKAYLTGIFQVLMQALSSAEAIGSNLRTLNTECSNAVNRLYNELVYQDEENIANLPSHDNQVAMNKYNEKKARQAERAENRELKKQKKQEEIKLEKAQQDKINSDIQAIKSRKELMANVTRDYILAEIKKAHERDEEYTLDDLKKKVIDDSEGNSKSLEKGDNKKYGTRIESLDKKKASAMASYILLNLIQQQPKVLNKIVFGSSPETILDSVFNDYFNDIYKFSEENSASKLNTKTLKKIEQPKEVSEKEKTALKNISVNPEEVKKKSSLRKTLGNLVSKTVENVGKSSGTGTYGKPAKDFEGETPKEPTDNMNIVQYATYKAKKLNER